MELFDYHSHLFTPIYYMLACFPSTVLTEYVIVMTVLFLIAGELTFCCSPNSSILYDILQIPYSTIGSVGRNKAYVTCDIYIYSSIVITVFEILIVHILQSVAVSVLVQQTLLQLH